MAHQMDGTFQAAAAWNAAMIVIAVRATQVGRRAGRGLFGRLHVSVHVLFGQPALCL
jgi:hypothetical protein